MSDQSLERSDTLPMYFAPCRGGFMYVLSVGKCADFEITGSAPCPVCGYITLRLRYNKFKNTYPIMHLEMRRVFRKPERDPDDYS